MNKIKADIPTQEVLQTKLRSIMKSGLADFVKSTNAQRIAVRASIRYVVVSVLFIMAIAVFLYLAKIDFNTLVGKVVMMIVLLWATVLLVSGRSWFIGSTLLAREINMALVPILANTLNRTLLYTYNEDAATTVREMIEDSALVPEKLTDLEVRNVYTVFTGVDMRVHEIKMVHRGDNSSLKPQNYHGTFIDVNLDQTQSTQTILSTLGNSFGFSHDDFAKALTAENEFSSVELSEISASNILAFSSTGEKDNQLITPELLQSLAAWGAEAKVNIRVMRKETKLYILVPGSKESTSYTSTSTKQEAVERYAELIARPVWRGLMLAEEVD